MHLFGFMRPNLNNKFALVIGNVCLQSIKKILILFFRSCMLTTIYVNNTFNILKRDFFKLKNKIRQQRKVEKKCSFLYVYIYLLKLHGAVIHSH